MIRFMTMLLLLLMMMIMMVVVVMMMMMMVMILMIVRIVRMMIAIIPNPHLHINKYNIPEIIGLFAGQVVVYGIIADLQHKDKSYLS